MTAPDHVLEKTRSLVDGTASVPTARRLLAIWEGGYATCGLPDSGDVVLGRGQTADLRLSATSVSREHAVLHVSDTLSIEDLGSSNGTRLDGVRLEPRRPALLSAGRLVELGDAIVVVQDWPGHAAAGARTGSPAPLPSEHGQMQRLHRLADLVARGKLGVILQGETGVGKEVMAKRIHERSARAAEPFLKINCAAFAESMVESELFGHERGAFTGASQAKVGLLESASGGTVLLDEVAELSLAMQAKLLRALGNAEILRVGSVKPRSIDVRFIAATNSDFESLMSRGAFRADLYFRLNGITLTIPPLRERADEIADLARHFANETKGTLPGTPNPLTVAAIFWLERQQWPGNIRELRSTVERAVLLAHGQPIEVQHLASGARSAGSLLPGVPPPPPLEPRASTGPEKLRDEVERMERQRITEAMARCGGNQTKAAELLGISRRALIHRLDVYELPRPRKGN